MSTIHLTQFDDANLRPSRRRTRCKNCCSMFSKRAVDWKDGDLIPAGAPRIVVSGGWGPASRHVTLCVSCAEAEAARLEALALIIREQTGKAFPLNRNPD